MAAGFKGNPEYFRGAKNNSSEIQPTQALHLTVITILYKPKTFIRITEHSVRHVIFQISCYQI